VANGEVTDLNKAEEELIKKALSGEIANFSGREPDNRTIDARVLRSLLLGLKLPAIAGISDERKAYDVRSIYAIAPIIKGTLDLLEAIGPEGRSLPPLILKSAIFESKGNAADINARHARLARLSLVNSKLTRLVLEDAKVGGDVDLSGVMPLIDGKGCQVLAQGCQVEGSFRADGAELRLPEELLNKERAPGEAYIDYALDLTNVSVDGDISLMCPIDLNIDGDATPEAQSIKNGRQKLRTFSADGVRLDLARVRGSVWFDGADLLRTNPNRQIEGYALHAHNCRIEGGLSMSGSLNVAEDVEYFNASGCVSLIGSRIDGNLDCRGAVLRNRPGKEDEAGDDPVDAEDKESNYSLNAKDAIIGGDALLRVSRYKLAGNNLLFRANNRVCLRGASIGGELDFRGSRFLKELDLANIDVGTNLSLGRKSDSDEAHRFDSRQKIILRNARVKGRFECANAVLETSQDGELGIAIDASEFRVDGNLIFSPTLKADASFDRCRVGGDLDLSDLKIYIDPEREPNGRVAPKLTFSDSIIDRRIAILRNCPVGVVGVPESVRRPLLNPFRPNIRLDGVEVGILADNGGLGWGKDVQLTLDGLTYKHLEQAHEPVQKDWLLVRAVRGFLGRYHLRISENRKEWLNLQYKRKRRTIIWRNFCKDPFWYKINRQTYRAQPYEHLAKVLDDQGWNEDSRHILMLKLELDGKWVPWLLRPLHWLFGLFFGFGLAHRKSIAVLVLYLVIGGFLFRYASDNHILVIDQNPVTTMVAHRKAVSEKLTGVETGQAAIPKVPDIALDTSDIDCAGTISPWIYALDSAIPFLDLREHQRCTIRSPAPQSSVFKWTNIQIPASRYVKLPWIDFAIDLPILWSIDSVELLWRYIRAFYTAFGWVITSVAVLTLTGVLRRTAEQ